MRLFCFFISSFLFLYLLVFVSLSPRFCSSQRMQKVDTMPGEQEEEEEEVEEEVEEEIEEEE